MPQSRLDRIVLTAMSRDAALGESVAREFAASALSSVSAGVDPDDAPELARRLLAAHPDLGASTATIVAAAVSDVLSEEQPAS